LLIETVIKNNDNKISEYRGSSNFSANPTTTNINSNRKPGKQIDDFFEEIKNRIDKKKDSTSSNTASGEGNANLSTNNSSNIDNAQYDDNMFGGGLELEKGSFDNGDPNTTNLYLGNLAPTTTG
jgi:U2-associated protein SR140